jgi:hypothetical protein
MEIKLDLGHQQPAWASTVKLRDSLVLEDWFLPLVEKRDAYHRETTWS